MLSYHNVIGSIAPINRQCHHLGFAPGLLIEDLLGLLSTWIINNCVAIATEENTPLTLWARNRNENIYREKE